MYDVVVKKFTFGVSSRDELLVITVPPWQNNYMILRLNITLSFKHVYRVNVKPS